MLVGERPRHPVTLYQRFDCHCYKERMDLNVSPHAQISTRETRGYIDISEVPYKIQIILPKFAFIQYIVLYVVCCTCSCISYRYNIIFYHLNAVRQYTKRIRSAPRSVIVERGEDIYVDGDVDDRVKGLRVQGVTKKKNKKFQI